MKLTITRAQLTEIEQQARRALPDEACGLIVGRVDSGDAAVTSIHASEGENSETSFEVDPALHIRLQRELRDSDIGIIGVYHSHPAGAAAPSARDAHDAAYPGWVWLITALEGGKPVTRAFLYRAGDGDAFQEVQLEVR